MDKEPVKISSIIITFLISYLAVPILAVNIGYGISFFISDRLNLKSKGESILIVSTVLILSLLLFYAFRKAALPRYSFYVNAFLCLFMSVVFYITMVVHDGTVRETIGLLWLLNPTAFVPTFLESLRGVYHNLPLMITSVYAAGCISSVYMHRKKRNLIVLFGVFAVVALLAGLDVKLYNNRPEVRYRSYNFGYMNGYSSTNFSDYMVYSKDSKLATLDHSPAFIIENESDMPVFDGAEACYPLYAAVAKTLYKDIDVIEYNNRGSYQRTNGKYVTFTNTIYAFNRLITKDSGYDGKTYGTDLVFGARPSADQLEEAKRAGTDLNITVIGKEAFVFFVEEDNPVSNLTADQARGIYHGDITNWKEVGGNNEKIVAFQRPDNSGSQTMMIYFMNGISLKKPVTFEEYEDAMTGVVERIANYANEDGAIGYSFRYFIEGLCQEQHVKLLSIDGVYPSLDTIENNTYPIVVDLCLITRENDTNPYVNKIIDFMLSEDGQYLVRETGYGRIRK